MPRYTTVEERFWSKVHQTRSCWIWTGYCMPFGHGQFSIASSKAILAHRYAWMLEHGPLLPGFVVCHQCKTPSCVRVSHLAVGTPFDNRYDEVRRHKGETPPVVQRIRDTYYHKATPEERFWDYVDKGPHPTGCWFWIGGKDQRGYGNFAIKDGRGLHVHIKAHRFSYQLVHGTIPDGLFICHVRQCTNTNCVNPSHLYAGTRAENSIDMSYVGTNRSAKIPLEAIPEIRALRHKVPQKVLAERFNVSVYTIGNIQCGRTHKYLPMA